MNTTLPDYHPGAFPDDVVIVEGRVLLVEDVNPVDGIFGGSEPGYVFWCREIEKGRSGYRAGVPAVGRPPSIRSGAVLVSE